MKNFIIQVDRNNRFNQIFIPLAHKFLEVIRKNGGTIFKRDDEENYSLKIKKVKIIFGAHANPEFWIKNASKHDIFVNLEKIYKDEFRSKNLKYLELLEKNTVLDFCSLNSIFLKKHYILKIPPFFVFPQKKLKKIEKKYDILFVGGVNTLRDKILKKISDEKFKLVTGFDIFSQNLDMSIKQSKLYLHLNFEPDDIFNHFKFAHSSLYETIYCGHSGNLIDNFEAKELIGLSLFEKDKEIISGINELIDNENLYKKTLMIQQKIARIYDYNFNTFVKNILLQNI